MSEAGGTAIGGHKVEACLVYLWDIKGTNVTGVEEEKGKVVGDELGREVRVSLCKMRVIL